MEPISLFLKRSSQCFGEITVFRCELDFSLEHILKYIYFLTSCPLFQQLKNKTYLKVHITKLLIIR